MPLDCEPISNPSRSWFWPDGSNKYRNVSNTTQATVSGLDKRLQAIQTTTENGNEKLLSFSQQTSAAMVHHSEALDQTTEISIRLEQNTQNIHRAVSKIETRLERFEGLLTQTAESTEDDSSANRQVARLVARPSDLRAMCDGLLSSTSRQSEVKGLPKDAEGQWSGFSGKFRPCYCTRRRKLLRNKSSWGPLFLETESVQTVYHTPECPLSRTKPPELQSKRAFGVTIPAVQRIVQNAVYVSLSLSFGAGGSTFGQSIDWTATVDRSRSPAFKIATVAQDVFHDYGALRISLQEAQRLLESCWRRLLWCYDQKMASPSDVNGCGQTVLATVVSARIADDVSCSPSPDMSRLETDF